MKSEVDFNYWMQTRHIQELGGALKRLLSYVRREGKVTQRESLMSVNLNYIYNWSGWVMFRFYFGIQEFSFTVPGLLHSNEQLSAMCEYKIELQYKYKTSCHEDTCSKYYAHSIFFISSTVKNVIIIRWLRLRQWFPKWGASPLRVYRRYYR